MARISADQRRKEFVDAAVRVIAEHGMSDATTRRIAEAADAPLAALHYCFHSKDELFVAVFEAQAEMLTDRLGPAPRGAGLGSTAAQALRDAISWLMENRDRALAAYDLQLWALRQDRAIAARGYDVHIEPLTKHLLLSCGPDDDPALAPWAARMITSIADGLVLQWFAFEDDEQLIRDTEAAAEMLANQLTGARKAATRQSKAGTTQR